MRSLPLDPGMISRLGDIGDKRAPHEAAGFILGDHIIELHNISETPLNRFEFTVEEVAMALLKAELLPSDKDWEDAVFWHTHPGGLVGPSEIDRENRVGPITHLVVSLTPEGWCGTLY